MWPFTKRKPLFVAYSVKIDDDEWRGYAVMQIGPVGECDLARIRESIAADAKYEAKDVIILSFQRLER